MVERTDHIEVGIDDIGANLGTKLVLARHDYSCFAECSSGLIEMKGLMREARRSRRGTSEESFRKVKQWQTAGQDGGGGHSS